MPMRNVFETNTPLFDTFAEETSHASDRKVGATSEISSTHPSPVNVTPAKVVVETKAGEILEADAAARAEGQPEGGEESANAGAFNPETGEINWDCPCLGGMAHGPCGPQFRVAFSCFVFSEAEPKGIDCVEKFRDMQDCFRAHPEVYAEELADDGDEPTDVPPVTEGEISPPPPSSPPSQPPNSTDGVPPPPTGGEGLEPPSVPPSDPPPPPQDIKIPESPPPLPPSPEPKPIPPAPEIGRSSPPGFRGGSRYPVPADPRPRPPLPVIVDPPAGAGPLDSPGGISSTKSSEKPQ
ncbi:Oxidoreductase [Serendipita sp. 399]|nr:Oxidoreductase [Serendipita sp. 399]